MEANPTLQVDTDFQRYVKSRQDNLKRHLDGGIPDYSFAMDHNARQKLNTIPGLYRFCKACTEYVVPLERKKAEQYYMKVGPSQYPAIYDVLRKCAKTLGIGIPALYIEPTASELNAYAYATDDSEPLVIITSALVERFTLEELYMVIGHECGHIHNNHVIYNTAATMLINGGLRAGGLLALPAAVMKLLTTSAQLALLSWSRAAEVTCDRAGVICSGGEKGAMSSFYKFLSGGILQNQEQFDYEAVMKQYDSVQQAPVKYLELLDTHPLPVKRMFAVREFMNSETYYKWHPEQKEPDQKLYTKAELDQRCSRYISVADAKKRK